MCGICGWLDFQLPLSNNREVIESMTKTLEKRGPDDYGYYIDNNVLFGHRRLIVVDPLGGGQPMIKNVDGHKYVIIYNGELYNTEEIRGVLTKKGYSFSAYSDTEVLLTAYIHWGIKCLDYLNGIFSFAVWDESKRSLLLARDQLGVKPLFYTRKGSSFIFASEIKALLKNPMVKPVLDRDGLTELFALGPATALGSGVLKDIKEVPPAHYMYITEDTIHLKEYWKLEALEFTESLSEATDHVRELLIDAISRQLIGDVPLCTFLSGGIDSSAISAIAAAVYKEQGKTLNTYSIDYQENDKYFKASSFQPTADADFIKLMASYIKSNHHNYIVDNHSLAEALDAAVLARDLPGMADVDSSLYLLCREIRKDYVIALSGECSDEIFGGYPWFRKPELLNADTFPWSLSLSERSSILSSELKSLPLEECARNHYQKTLKEVPHLPGEAPEEYRMREIVYLNIKWFMVNLLNRKDRMSMANSLEVRVPFADKRLVQYAFNLPNSIRFADNMEKGLLRRALQGILPEEILKRKKSPYPKTHNPKYTNIVASRLENIISNSESPILPLIDRNKICEIIKSGGSSYKSPWFGQLMTGPQLIAYLIQLNTWLKTYNIKVEP
ncbi:asparagine synthase (glutamine-hydrolyzing) [Alloiococcus sp. CFN-8]|uniref:asparagine synthase (glutamine-hydrolyzing) n=1 Tax=Alloiococcus sp. CFN-8 TaxID=3416081 RepID=UPI003CF691AD